MSKPFNTGDRLEGVPQGRSYAGWIHFVRVEEKPHNWGFWNCVLSPEDIDNLYQGADPRSVQKKYLTASGYCSDWIRDETTS